MTAILFVARRRIAGRWFALVAAGLVLGLGFGLSLASFAAARRTASAYDRILVASDAPDAAVTHVGSPEESVRSLATVDGIVRQRPYAGVIGSAAGLDRAFTSALLVQMNDEFPLDLPFLREGRLPNPDARDEIFVNTAAADALDLHVGQRLDFTLFTNDFQGKEEVSVEIVGIGTLAPEQIADETTVFTITVFSRAFFEAHRDLIVYSVSNIDVAPGVDARRDIAPAVTALGHELQSSRTQEHQAVNDALQPLIIILTALGVLAFGATAVAAAQFLLRDGDRARVDTETLMAVGMLPAQVRCVQVALASVVAVVAVSVALVVTVVLSPVAPVGPLHDLDPAQGFNIDATVAIAGTVAIAATIMLLAFAHRLGATRRRTVASRVTIMFPIPRPAAIAGTALTRTARSWRAVGALTLATMLLALIATFAASAATLAETPSRYGFDAHLAAVNPYGDQAEDDLRVAFGGSEVVAATGFTAGSFLVDGRAVPGVAMTPLKGTPTPIAAEGRLPRVDDEVALGLDTLDEVDASIGDTVKVELGASAGGSGDPNVSGTAGPARNFRIVGAVIFPAVSQTGTDMPRLGTGLLMTHGGFVALGANPENAPEFTTVRLTDDTDPQHVIAQRPEGFEDEASATVWFTETKPAEVRQLDEAMPFVRAALVLGYLIVLAVVIHALWTRARANRRALAVLRSMGATTRQLDEVTAWQAVPITVAAIVLGVPIGIGLGRLGFARFARSFAVVDEATTTALGVVALAAAVLLAVLIAVAISILAGRRSRTAVSLREG
jgi:hypothetical protein